MDMIAFARARKFLDYHPVARWLAVVCSVLASVLFLVLILILALFVDLVVSRGEVPALLDLSPTERAAFLAEAAIPDDLELAQGLKQRARDTLARLKLPSSSLKSWLAGEPAERLPYHERALAWYVSAANYLDDAVGEKAGGRVLESLDRRIEARGLDAALAQALPDCGLLSLAVRARGTLAGRLVANLAAWHPWTWADGNTPYLFGIFLIAVVIAAARYGMLFTANYAAALATLEATTRLRRAAFHHSHRLGALAFEAQGPTEAVAAATRHLETVQDGLHRWQTVLFREPVKVGLLLLFAFWINFWLALAFALFAMLVWVVGGQTATVLRRRGRAAQGEAARQLALVQESMTLTRLVKVFLMESFNQARVERQLRSYAEAQRTRYRAEAIYRALFALLGLVAALVLLLAAGFIVLQGHLAVSSAMVLVTALAALYWPVRAILDTRRALRRAGEAARALFAFLDRSGGVGQAVQAEFLPPLCQALELDRVTLHEPGSGRKLLRGVSLRIAAGQRVALVGTDPAQAQALVSLLPRFFDPTSGEVRIDGKNLRWVTLDSLRTQIGMVLQQNLVFSDTVANNIGCGDPAYNLHRIVEAAKTAHAHQFIQRLPNGYETVIGELGHALNAGEMFRVALARAILRDPALYVIEESPSPLDDDTKALLADTLQRVLRGRTVLFLPQRLSTIRSCDQVLLLHNGRIAAAGEHRELLSTSDLYKHLQYLQFSEFAGLVSGSAPGAEEAP